MPQIDLEPEEYRRDKGWRWRLKWSDPEDNKLPLVMFFVGLAMIGAFVLNAAAVEPMLLGLVTAGLGFVVGIQFTLWMRR